MLALPLASSSAANAIGFRCTVETAIDPVEIRPRALSKYLAGFNVTGRVNVARTRSKTRAGTSHSYESPKRSVPPSSPLLDSAIRIALAPHERRLNETPPVLPLP